MCSIAQSCSILQPHGQPAQGSSTLQAEQEYPAVEFCSLLGEEDLLSIQEINPYLQLAADRFFTTEPPGKTHSKSSCKFKWSRTSRESLTGPVTDTKWYRGENYPFWYKETKAERKPQFDGLNCLTLFKKKSKWNMQSLSNIPLQARKEVGKVWNSPCGKSVRKELLNKC